MTYRLLLSQKAPLSPSQSDILPASKHLSLILLRTYLFSFVSDLNRNCSTNYCTTICVVYNIPLIHAISHKLDFGETYQCLLISFTATDQKCIEYRIQITLSIKMFPRTIMKMSSLWESMFFRRLSSDTRETRPLPKADCLITAYWTELGNYKLYQTLKCTRANFKSRTGRPRLQ